MFPNCSANLWRLPDWSFLTNHARVLVCIAEDPGVRLRDIALSTGITERSVFSIVGDLIAGGCVAKEKEGRRNRYHIQADSPLGETIGPHRTVGQLLKVIGGTPPKGGRRRPQRR